MASKHDNGINHGDHDDGSNGNTSPYQNKRHAYPARQHPTSGAD